MSHYTVVESQIKDKKALIAALKRFGFEESSIEVEENMPIKTYDGNTVKDVRCDVRIKGASWGSENSVGRLCNDIGFEKTKEGTYKIHVCNYAENAHKDFRTKIKQYYECETAKTFAKRNKYFYSEKEVDGEINIEIKIPY